MPKWHHARVELVWHLTRWQFFPLIQYRHQLAPAEEPKGRKPVFSLPEDRVIANETLVVCFILCTLTAEAVWGQAEATPKPVQRKAKS